MRYPHLWTRLYGTPLLLHPEKARIIEQVFRSFELGGEVLVGLASTTPGVDDAAATETAAEEKSTQQHVGLLPARRDAGISAALSTIRFQKRDDKPYALTDSGIAVIPVLGTLVQRGSWMDAMSGMTSYGRIEGLVGRAAADHDVKGILLEVDSFGGEANGCFDCAEKIFAARDHKPVWASVNEQAYSAGYALTAAAEKIYLPRSGMLGSIGVIALHVDQSKRDASQGYAYTFIYAGARKKDFNSHEPLSKEARTAEQEIVDRLYGLFVDGVARMRAISPTTVRATEAALLSPDQAVAGGFADGVANFSETLALFEAHLAQRSTGTQPAGRSFNRNKENQMSDIQKPAGNQHAEKVITQADLDAARTTALAEGERAGRSAERTRIAAILASDEAKDRPASAQSVAMETDMGLDDAKKFLAKLPKEAAAPKAGGQFSQVLAAMNPKVGASSDGAASAADETVRIDAQAIYQSRAAAARQTRH